MPRARVLSVGTGVLTIVALLVTPLFVPEARADEPFSVSASAGPQASSAVQATVTRTSGGSRLTLPAAVVPALEPGDVVDVHFTDYLRPPALTNYHVNVAFITETAPQRWLFQRSVPQDRLFAAHATRGPHGIKPPPPIPDLRFTYGSKYYRGIPIFFIVPEDAKTRGMDGVRDYVDAHPTDFKDMAESVNDAVDKYDWFRDFLSSLANGSIDPYSSEQRVVDVATSLGASPASVQACYQTGGTRGDVANCIGNSLNGVGYSTNIAASTPSQFLGGVAGAALPVTVASYLVPLLTLWKIFFSSGHQEYEYLPTTLNLATPAGNKGAELLMGLKVPTLRPPAALSSALFFTIGDPQSSQAPPAIVDGGASTGVCAAGQRVGIPLHFDRTSRYLNDTALIVTPDGMPSFRVPIDPRSVAAPSVDRSLLGKSPDGAFSVELKGRFGFDPLVEPEHAVVRIALPRKSLWVLASNPHEPPRAGGSLDLIASSPQSACLSGAEMQVGSAPPVALDIKHLDDRRVALHASLASVPAGIVSLRLFQQDAAQSAPIENDATLSILQQPAHVDLAATPSAHLDDRSIALDGSGFESIDAFVLGKSTYLKDKRSTSQSACFTGPPLVGSSGETLSGQLVSHDGSPGEIFVLHVGPARPALEALQVLSAQTPTVRLATEPLGVVIASAGGALPREPEVRIRRAVPDESPCDESAPDALAESVPDVDVYRRSPSQILATLRPEQELGDRAFGSLQIRIVDGKTKAASSWMDLPGTFARAPIIDGVLCPKDTASPCTLVGTELGAIDAVRDAAGDFVPPGTACTTEVKGAQCRTLPHLNHFVLRLTDTQGTISVPDASIGSLSQTEPNPTATP